ncbi:MAG: ImmA/IrrE family metallo-endopeptidase [Chloroflexota bacterium]|nr:ImmA/IrrE family metallo-endopeptidase [Chloroflexota bacterium]
MAKRALPYEPDYATPPGLTLRSTLDSLGMTQADLAARTGLSLKHVNQVVQGVAPVTHETALLLEKVTGVPARIWNSLEATYRDRVLRMDDREVLASDAEWLSELPIKELVRRGRLPARADHATLVDEVCRFFGVANRTSWERVWRDPLASFRRSTTLTSDAGAVAAWLRIGEIDAHSLDVKPFDARRFRQSLEEIRELTVLSPEEFVPQLREACSRSGVALVFVPEIKGARCWGAARWLTPIKALIELSLRYKSDDHLWFSFFHEAAHLLLHGKKETYISTDRFSDPVEEEANAFAATFLIPRKYEARLRALRLNEVREFADELGIAPGIVVGRLQKEGILGWDEGNSLKKRFAFRE